MSDRRTGNIAQLPRAVRDQVNQMLDDGCRYQKIITWLNHNGHPGIKPNNLTAWRTGGYQDWLAENRELAREEKLLELSHSVRGEFHVKSTPIMQAAQRSRVQTALRLFSLGVPVNVINQNLDLGLPDLPHGQTCYLPDLLHALGQVQPAVPKSLPHDPSDPSSVALLRRVDRCLALLPALELQLHQSEEARRE